MRLLVVMYNIAFTSVGAWCRDGADADDGSGSIYTTTFAEPTRSLTQAGRGSLHLHLRCGPDTNQKFVIVISPNVSSGC